MRPVSPMLKDVLINDGADAEKISVLPSHLVTSLAVLNSIFERRAQIKKQIREQYQIPQNAPLLVTLSGNQKSKGLHILAGAWPQILREIPNCHWLLCGPVHPWLESHVFPVLESSKTKSPVHITGALSGNAVFEHLAASDLHINATLGEGLNMVTVEAAAVGTPTISSDGAGIAGWLERLNCGASVATGNSAALAETVIDVLKNAPLRLTWEQNCRRMAHEFDLERIANGLISLLK
jgi:glycosyltransferase involved in cell wall biosynthesis